MTTWNYRLVSRFDDKVKHSVIGIYSVYYDKDGNPEASSVEQATLLQIYADDEFDTIEDIRKDLEKMIAINKPVLDENDIGTKNE